MAATNKRGLLRLPFPRCLMLSHALSPLSLHSRAFFVSVCLFLSLFALKNIYLSLCLCLFVSALKSVSVSLGLTLYSRAFFLSNKRVCVDPSASLLTVCHQSRKVVSLESVSSPLNLNINSLYAGYFFFFFFFFFFCRLWIFF